MLLVYSGTPVYGHLTSKVTSPMGSPLLSPKISFPSAMIRTFSPGNTVTSPLMSLLLSPIGDLNSEVPLYTSWPQAQFGISKLSNEANM